MTARRVMVFESGLGPYGQVADVRGHRLSADEPVSSGGLDSGPDPFELVLSGLGACTAMTVRMYANRKGWPVTGVSVETTMERARPGEPPGRGSIERRLVIEGDLDDSQRDRLVEIADRCPVGRLLAAGAEIRTSLAQPTSV